jgi:hypothetical protein
MRDRLIDNCINLVGHRNPPERNSSAWRNAGADYVKGYLYEYETLSKRRGALEFRLP